MSITQKALRRRQFLQLIGGMANIVVIAACTKSSVDRSAETPAPEQKDLIFWGRDQHPLDLAAEGFMQQHANIKWISPHPADRSEKLNKAFATGEELPDLYWAEATEAQDWGCRALLLDLSDQLKPEIAQYHPAKVAESFVAKRGQYVGWPGDIGVSGWYYREDKLQEAGFGAVDLENITWPDFLAMAVELRKHELYTFCFPADGWAALFFFALHQVGGTAVSRDGQTLTVGDGPGIAAMQIVKNLWDSGGGLDEGWWSPSYWAALKEGKLIGDFAAAWAKGFWEANLRDAEDKRAFGNWRIAKFPGGDGIKYRTGIWGGAQLVTPKAAQNTDGALLFMKYALNSVEGAALCSQGYIIPAYRPYLKSKAFLEQKSPFFGDWEFGKFWAGQEQELSTEYFRPAGWDAVANVVQKEMVNIINGELGVEDGMARIVELATPHFERTRCAA